ncbi:MAG: MBL fold metallo-hydrolase [Chloroflexi bacterium]|nr:MBL fold metallo-hydrolase [Myxococcales bacterium]MCZ6531285.1 MBL fold metallo-hydrolase [Chloroflexota bacterium]
MKITLLGHASILVEIEGAICLMDPVFSDPFEGGAVVSCPRRKVYLERLPAIDTLIISHRHPDHFDLRSLAQVTRDCDAICPADPLIVYALKKLGFSRVHPVHPMGEIMSQSFELYPTRSEMKTVPEFGMVFKDRSGCFWNQVDTFLSLETIQSIAARFGRVDLLFAMYASQNFEFFENRTTEFPYDEHRRNLENVLRINPRMVVPGSAGFAFCGDHAWLNAFLFPVSRQRFVSDLQRIEGGIQTQLMNPGDIFEIDNGRVRHFDDASDIAVMEEDDSAKLSFDPTAPIPELNDPNPDGYSLKHLKQETEKFVREGIGSFVAQDCGKPDPLLDLYQRRGVRYEITIVFPDAQVTRYQVHFDNSGGRMADPASSAGAPDLSHRIAASALVGWLERKKSFFYVRAYSRRFSTLHELSRSGDTVRLRPEVAPDLLMHYLLNVAPGSDVAARDQIDLEIEALHREGY